MRYPLPVPFGWFGIGWADALAPREVRPLYLFDTHLVLWRDAAGAAHVHDPFCPHLGAHLGHGGTVEGTEIVCPFHGWHYDAAGTNTEIPYSSRCNARARLRTYPIVERNGMVMVWWHPDEAVGPAWEVPELEELTDGTWGEELRTEHSFDAHVQELAENQVDSAHFRFVHSNPATPVIDSYVTGFPEATMAARQVIMMPDGPVEANLQVTSLGMGMSIVRFSGIIDTIDVAYPLPVSADECMVRSSLRISPMGDDATTRAVGEVFLSEIDRQMVNEDGPVWQHKAYLRRPALAAGDGPFTEFRRWAAQFHPTPVTSEVDVWPSPYWADRLDERPSGIGLTEQIADVLAPQPSATAPEG